MSLGQIIKTAVEFRDALIWLRNWSIAALLIPPAILGFLLNFKAKYFKTQSLNGPAFLKMEMVDKAQSPRER